MKKKNGNDRKERDCIALVTGATSELGRLVVRQLLEMGHEVRAVVKINPDNTEEWKEIPRGVIPYVADLTQAYPKDKDTLVEACRGVDKVFHIAAAVYNYRNTVERLMSVNVIGTENLLNAILEANPNKKEVQVIFAGTISVYGHQRGNETITEESEVKPRTPYARSKYIAEQVLQSYNTAYPSLKYTILRIGTIYGEGYEKPSFYKFFRLIKEGELRYVGSGENHLTLINVKDAAAAFILASENDTSLNKIYNLTDGKAYTQKYLYTLVAKRLNVKPPEKHIHPFIAKMGIRTKKINIDEFDFVASNRIVSIDKIKKELRFSPKAKMEVEGTNMIDACFA